MQKYNPETPDQVINYKSIESRYIKRAAHSGGYDLYMKQRDHRGTKAHGFC